MNWWNRNAVRQLLALPLAVIGRFVPGEPVLKSLAAWDIYAFCYLLLTWLTFRGLDASSLREVTVASSRRRVADRFFAAAPGQLTQLAAGVAMIATLVVLPQADKQGTSDYLTLAIGIAAVVSSWITLQVGFVIVYMGLYVDGGGLRFPGDEDPEVADFAYFAFSVATTLGTTDVQVTRRAVRRQVLVHTLLAFVFNTLILAIAVTVVTSYIADR